ncbi:MAG TPA: SDR family oxidoreductase [Acidimicrobiales bacterium]
MTTIRRTAVITGASAGVGRETARIFAKNGYDVALLARGDAGLRAAAREVESFGQRCLIIPTDVADFAQVDDAATQVELELGPIHVWVNNAMTTVFSPLAAVEPEDFERAVQVTFLGQVWGTMTALKRMRQRDVGSIINVGSALAFVGIPLQSVYCASKFACRGFFEATRAELLHDRSHVRISMVHLPAMNTPQFDWCETTMDRHPQPVPPIYQPEIAAQAIFDTAVDGKRARIVGSWNKMLVVMDSFFPGLGNHFASLGAWNSQLTKQPVRNDRPSNLRAPADSDVDYGGHGIFDNKARGVKDPSFLITLPKIAVTYLRASELTVREKIEVRKRADLHRRHTIGAPSATHPGVVDPQESDPHLGVHELTSTLEPPTSPVEATSDTPNSTERTNSENSKGDVKPESSDNYSKPAKKNEKSALDTLENEDRWLLQLFQGIALNRGTSVEERYAYGNLAKEILRHIAIRQASLVNVATVITSMPELHAIGSRMMDRATHRRVLIDASTQMARGIQPVSLSEGQDFGEAFDTLINATRSEIEWELSEAISLIRATMIANRTAQRLRSSRYVRRHAPTYLSTKGPRWYERAPVVSRIFTIYEHMNDFPRASREWRSS